MREFTINVLKVLAKFILTFSFVASGFITFLTMLLTTHNQTLPDLDIGALNTINTFLWFIDSFIIVSQKFIPVFLNTTLATGIITLLVYTPMHLVLVYMIKKKGICHSSLRDDSNLIRE